MKADLIREGAVLREHGETNHTDIGRVVHVDSDGRSYWWIPFPSLKAPKSDPTKDNENEEEAEELETAAKGRLQAYIKRPRQAMVSEAKKLAGQGLLSSLDFRSPPEWLLTEDQLKNPPRGRGPNRRRRRNYARWIALRDAAWALIAPIVKGATERGTTLGHMLESGDLFEQIDTLCRESKALHKMRTEQALFRYMLGGCEKNSLLPGWRHCGNEGTTKFTKVKTGRPNTNARTDPLDLSLRGYICGALDRNKLARGYRKYKAKEGLTVEKAYVSTMEEFYALSVTYRGPGDRVVKLRPPELRPTEWEFRTHGPNKRPEAKASRLNLGEIFYTQNKRALKGTARDGIVAIGQVGWIDSTPEDQNLVSAASRLKQLPTSHRTMIVEAKGEYILGIYAGFEPSSTMTGLLALLHAASSKVEWCARWGVEIAEDDWLSFLPRRLRGDNGDLKSDDGIQTLVASEVGLEVVQAWKACLKGPAETKHKVLHRDADHLSAGTSHGKQQSRDRPRPDASACLTFAEKMPTLIRAILRHNNDDLVPERLTIEMRNDFNRDGIKPTRKAIFQWQVKKGYVVTEPKDIDLLRAKCLPRFKARIDGGRIMIFDPRAPETRLIPELHYWSDWLHTSGLTESGRKRVIPCEIHLDPTYPSEAWLNVDGMHRLELRTADPLMREVTLCDWMAITDDDSLVKFLARGELQDKAATHVSSARAANEEAMAAKAAELSATPNPPTKTAMRSGKRANRADEIEHQKNERAGINAMAPVRQHYSFDAAADDGYVDPDDDPLMNLVRTEEARS